MTSGRKGVYKFSCWLQITPKNKASQNLKYNKHIMLWDFISPNQRSAIWLRQYYSSCNCFPQFLAANDFVYDACTPWHEWELVSSIIYSKMVLISLTARSMLWLCLGSTMHLVNQCLTVSLWMQCVFSYEFGVVGQCTGSENVPLGYFSVCIKRAATTAWS